MKHVFIFITLFFSCFFTAQAARAISVDEILTKVESRYSSGGFSADFLQTTTIKSLNLTDQASGRMWIQRPNKIRWEYVAPESQIIVSNGTTVWMYRPSDKQVFQGKSEVLFGKGKGGMFLSNPKLIRQYYTFFLEDSSSADQYVLKLIPREKDQEVALVRVTVSKDTFNIVRLTTNTPSGEQNTIDIKNITFTKSMNSKLFQFTIPQDAQIIQLNQRTTK